MEVDFAQVQKVVGKLLAGGTSRDDVRGITGEAKRLATRLSHKPDARAACELIHRLATQSDFHRTKQTPRYFASVRDALNLLGNRPAKEQAVLLGWACRLAAYEAVKREQQQGSQSVQPRGGQPPRQLKKGGKRR